MNPINRFIQIVLVETSHPGNIGSVARAMKNMGLAKLALINPKKFPHQDATALAGNATDLLENAQVFDSIQTAVKGSKVIYATSARDRTIEWPILSAKDAAEEIQELVNNNIEVSIIFGRETSTLRVLASFWQNQLFATIPPSIISLSRQALSFFIASTRSLV